MSNIIDTFNSVGFPGFPTGTLPKKHDPTQDNPGFWSSFKSGLADADWGSALFGSPQEEAVAAANSWKNAKTLGGLEGGFSPTSLSKAGIKTGIYTPPTQQYTVVPGTPGRPGIGEQILGAGINAGMGALFACDERVKVDMAPLESSDINDDLAEIAFFVKGIRECS